MKNRLIKQPVQTYIPAVPAVIGRPAYCTSEVVEVDVLVRNGSYITIKQDYSARRQAGDSIALNEAPSVTFFSGTTTTERRKVRQTTCYPEIKGVAGRDAVSTTDNQAGWNAGGRSVAAQDGDLCVTFVVDRSPTGVLCGLADPLASIGSFNSIEHGIFSDGERFKVYESGRLVFTSSQGANAQPALAITRIGTTVTYQIGNDAYVSGNPSRGAKALTAALYIAGDYVDQPSIGPARSMAADIEWFLSGSAGAGTAGSTTAVYPMEAAIDWTLAGEAFLGNRPAIKVPPTIDTSSVSLTLPLMMSAVSGEVLVDDAILAFPVVMRAGEEPAEYASITLPLGVEAWEESQRLTDTVIESIVAVEGYSSPLLVYTFIQESLTLGTVLDVLLAIEDDLFESLVLRSDFTVALLLEEILRERLSVSDDARAARQLALQYATNLATGAVTRYEGYDFKGYLQVGGQTLAWRPAGLYRLGGVLDDGRTLEAFIEFAAEDFGTSATKMGESVYFGLDSDGEAVIKIVDDHDQEYLYRVRGEAPTVRAQLGRGLRSKMWRMQLQVAETSRLDLDSVEWVVRTSTRRLTR